MSKRASKSMPSILRFLRLFVVLLMLLSFSFVPFHIITESHAGSDIELAQDQDEHDADHADQDHNPHPESDHSVDALAVAKAKLHSIAFVCAILTTQDRATEPQLSFSRFSFRTLIPPNADPPDPLQPRAPPVA
jgi:hypothetical protein